MNTISYYSFYLILINLIVITRAEHVDEDNRITAVIQESSSTEFTPHRYDRHFFLFLANDSAINYFHFRTFLRNMGEVDHYCGGEMINIKMQFSNKWDISDQFASFYEFIAIYCQEGLNQTSCLNNSTVSEAIATSVNPNDTGRMAETLIKQTNQLCQNNYDIFVTTQVILITNYVTDSLKDKTTINTLLELKEKRNVTFISFNMNLTDGHNVSDYFPQELWISRTGYTMWFPNTQVNGTNNPICEYTLNPYSRKFKKNSEPFYSIDFFTAIESLRLLYYSFSATPSPPFDGDMKLNIYLFLSRDYINRVGIADGIELFSHLAARRWHYPCRQYRITFFDIWIPDDKYVFQNYTCVVEDTDLDNQTTYCTSHTEQYNWFSAWIDKYVNTTYAHDITCKHYDTLFHEFKNEPSWVKSKYLLISDIPMKCPNNTWNISSILDDKGDYTTGAPLTAIAIDKTSKKDVYNSLVDLFPPTQAPNLYSVNSISDLLPNISKSIYFCLDAAPPLILSTPKPLPPPPSLWYLYLIGAIILTSLLLAATVVFIKARNKKRIEAIREFRARMNNGAHAVQIESNIYNYDLPPRIIDKWEVPFNSLDIHYNKMIGEGAFSIVYSGFLRGKAPVLDVYPSVALQNFIDCEVAIKTLPEHHKESDKSLFLSEIRLMKDIGYQTHLVNILGCNCSIETPILILELAEYSLLQWLKLKCGSIAENEINTAKTLLSFSWQISDGMSYLSSNLFIHRDLAARNVLLNKGLKAMVSDFGLCHKLDHAEQVVTISGGKLPVKWLALESLLEHRFSIKTDVWSFGVLLYEIYCLGQEPYGSVPVEGFVKHLQEGKRLEQPKLANEALYELMKGCWHAVPASRPDFATIQKVLGGMLENSTENYGYLQAAQIEV